jgi:hypothetical protein
VNDDNEPRTLVRQDRVNAALAEVSSVLWRVRELLDLLVFKLEEEQLLLAAGRPRWLTRATHEVEIVLEEIRHAELQRALEVDEAARLLGLPDAPSLRELSERAPEPWGDILREHRAAFLAATAEVSAHAEANRELLTASYLAVRETLTGLGGRGHGNATYTAAGSTTAASHSQLVDRAM